MRAQLRAEKYLQIMCNIVQNSDLNFILYTAWPYVVFQLVLKWAVKIAFSNGGLLSILVILVHVGLFLIN